MLLLTSMRNLRLGISLLLEDLLLFSFHMASHQSLDLDNLLVLALELLEHVGHFFCFGSLLCREGSLWCDVSVAEVLSIRVVVVPVLATQFLISHLFLNYIL